MTPAYGALVYFIGVFPERPQDPSGVFDELNNRNSLSREGA